MRAKCALIQQHFGADRAANVEHGADLVRRAAADGAEIICLSELATSFYFCHEFNPDYFELAEPIPGPSTRVMQAAARDASAYVIFPLYERDLSDGQLYNTAVVIDRNGEIAGKYRKNMIPLSTGPVMVGLEKYYFRPGNLGYPVFTTDLGINIGITICYERHFPEGARSLALANADVIFVPTATAGGRPVWELELQGHAIANLLWVAGVNRVGVDDGGGEAKFYGSSCFVSPTGEVVAQAGNTDEEILHWEIDTALSQQLRGSRAVFRDRRPETYAAITAP